MITEGFPTFVTFIEILSHINSLWLSKVCTVTEYHAIFNTLKMSFPSMNSLMLNKDCAITENLPTFIAFIGLFFSMILL